MTSAQMIDGTPAQNAAGICTRSLVRQPDQRFPLLTSLAICWTVAIGSASAQFTTVINIPPEPNLPAHSIRGSGTQYNLAAGGQIGRAFDWVPQTKPSGPRS